MENIPRVVRQILDGDTHAQASGGIEVVFESDKAPPSGMMKVWEAGEYRGELRFLRYPDSGEPQDNPWHAKVLGPDTMNAGRPGPLWSGSFDDRDEAEAEIKRQLRRQMGGGERGQINAGTGETVAYALLHPDGYLVKKGFHGKTLFADLEEARAAQDDPKTSIVRLDRVE